jgi:hypothetical protein
VPDGGGRREGVGLVVAARVGVTRSLTRLGALHDVLRDVGGEGLAQALLRRRDLGLGLVEHRRPGVGLQRRGSGVARSGAPGLGMRRASASGRGSRGGWIDSVAGEVGSDAAGGSGSRCS